MVQSPFSLRSARDLAAVDLRQVRTPDARRDHLIPFIRRFVAHAGQELELVVAVTLRGTLPVAFLRSDLAEEDAELALPQAGPMWQPQIKNCLETDPVDRFQSALDLASPRVLKRIRGLISKLQRCYLFLDPENRSTRAHKLDSVPLAR